MWGKKSHTYIDFTDWFCWFNWFWLPWMSMLLAAYNYCSITSMKAWVNVHDCHPNEPNFLSYHHLFAPILLLLSDNCSETDLQYIFRNKEKGSQCSYPLSLHPRSLFPSVIVIFERLDWRQWQKREGETCCHSCTLCQSLCMLPPHLPHSPSPLLSPWSHVRVLSNS